MNHKTKKVIAREFLLLLFCVVISLITFLIIYPYNFIRKNQMDAIDNQIDVKRETIFKLSTFYKSKQDNQYWYTEQYYSSHFDVGDLNGVGRNLIVSSLLDSQRKRFEVYATKNSNSVLWKRLYKIARSDSVKIKWVNIWHKDFIEFHKFMGFSSPDTFKSFILANTMSSEDLKKNKLVLKEGKEYHILGSTRSGIESTIISRKDQISYLKGSLIVSIIILYFLRYLFYSITWSFRMLKT